MNVTNIVLLNMLLVIGVTVLCFFSVLLRIRLPAWLSLEIAGGLTTVLKYCEDSEDKENNPDGNNNRKKNDKNKLDNSPKNAKAELITKNLPEKDPSGYKKTGGIVLPQAVPGTDISMRPGDSTTYVVGTVAGDVLLVKS